MEEEKIIPAQPVAEKPKRKRKPAIRQTEKKMDEFLQERAIPPEQSFARAGYVAAAEEKKADIAAKIETVSDVFGQEASSEDRRKKIIKTTAIAVSAVFILSLVGATGYFYYKYKTVSAVNATQNEIKSYTDKIGKFMFLPDGEPALATVTDKEKLKDQPFFAAAQNGDKVLIYARANEAILYRPSADKIVNIVSLSAGVSSPLAPTPTPDQSQAQPSSTEATSNQATQQAAPETATVAVYNGTNIKGLATNVAGKLAQIEGTSVAKTANAVGTYETTLVVNLNSKDQLAQKIADTLGAQVTADLPAGEKKPIADILVIAGSDFKN